MASVNHSPARIKKTTTALDTADELHPAAWFEHTTTHSVHKLELHSVADLKSVTDR